LTDLDRQMLGWTPPDIPLIIVMTKSDKLGRQQVRQAVREVAQDPLLAARQASLLVLPFSILSRIGVENLQTAVEGLITGASVDWRRQAADGVLVFHDPHARDPEAARADPFQTEPAGNAP
jgi:hypothetical protein